MDGEARDMVARYGNAAQDHLRRQIDDAIMDGNDALALKLDQLLIEIEAMGEYPAHLDSMTVKDMSSGL